MAKQNDSKPRPEAAGSNTPGNLKTAEQKPAAARPLTTNTGNYPSGRKLTPKQEAIRRRAQKRRRTQLLVIGGLVVVIALALIAIIVAVSQPTKFEALPAAATTDERPLEIGPADAKVTVEEYGDYQCPGCKLWHDTSQSRLTTDYIKAGKGVKFVFRPYPFLDARAAQRESHTTLEAAYCASDQKRFWDYHDALYNNQPLSENSGFWSVDRTKQLASALKLDVEKFNKCVDANTYRAKANADASAAINKGINQTPTFLVNGTKLSGADYSELQKAIDEALNSPAK